MINKFSTLLCNLSMLLCVVALAFRSTLYWRIPVASNEAISLGDLIEFYLLVSLLGTCVLAVLLGLVLALVPRIRLLDLAFRLLATGVGCFLVGWFIHPLMPRLM